MTDAQFSSLPIPITEVSRIPGLRENLSLDLGIFIDRPPVSLRKKPAANSPTSQAFCIHHVLP